MLPMHLLLFAQGLDEDEGASSSSRFWWFLATLALVLVVAVLLLRTLFFVDETEYVYVTQFGQPVRLYSEAGLGLKMPYQSVWRFDRRLQMYAPPAREMLTEDKENLNFQWYVCWQIPGRSFVADTAQSANDASRELDDEVADSSTAGSSTAGSGAVASDAMAGGTVNEPANVEQYVRRFLQSVGTMENAESRLEERIQAAIAAEVGRSQLQHLVTLNADELRLEAITRRVLGTVRQVAAEQFGIEVVDIRLKRFNYPPSVKESVYAAIRSERETKAVEFRAEGASEKAKIESLADLHRDKLLSLARRDATTVRGQGEARAIEILNAAHSKDPQFYELLKTLETYRTILDDQTTVVLSASSPLLRLLTRGLPSLTDENSELPSESKTVPPTPTTSATVPDETEDTRIVITSQEND